MKIQRFEDIEAWQQARVLANLVYDATENSKFARDVGLREQIRRAAGSVMHNLAEGFDAGSDPELIRFLKYSRRSSNEVQSEAYLAMDRTYISQDHFQQIHDQATRTKKLINGFITYQINSNTKGKNAVQLTNRPSDHPTN